MLGIFNIGKFRPNFSCPSESVSRLALVKCTVLKIWRFLAIKAKYTNNTRVFSHCISNELLKSDSQQNHFISPNSKNHHIFQQIQLIFAISEKKVLTLSNRLFYSKFKVTLFKSAKIKIGNNQNLRKFTPLKILTIEKSSH